jgi:PAS domain-containing protein
MNVESQVRLRALVETSPAAIVTVDERGFIELANQAAIDLMAPRDGKLLGNPIAAFLPELHHALRWEEAPQFRASMQCSGHRGRMSRPQLKVGAAGKFILRYFLGNVRWLFSSENDGESPEVLMTDDLPEMLFGE